MTLTEAIKSGAQFKRPSQDDWIEVHHDRMHWVERGTTVSLEVSSIIAIDWELRHKKPPTKTVIPFTKAAALFYNIEVFSYVQRN